MKKILTLFFVLVISISMCITSYASDNIQTDDDLEIILNEQLDEADYQKLSNKNNYDSSIIDVTLEGKPIIKVYNEIYWNVSDLPLNDIVAHANLSKTIDYIVFDNSPVRLRMYESNTEVKIGSSPNGVMSMPVNDIQMLSKDMTILDTTCAVTNIIYFDGFSSHMGASVYYITTNGNFVKYYRNEYSEGVWFTENDYRNFAAQYYGYLTSPENNYNEHGEPIGGGTLSFLDFIATVVNETPSAGVNGVQNPNLGEHNPDLSIPLDTPANDIYWIVGFIILGIVVISSIGIISIKQVSKRKNFAKKQQ